jgi:hypothetical protein
MAAIISNQSWRDRSIERSRVLTDGFEVALTWAGGLADWILFLCLVSNIVEVLAHLAGTPFSNIVMGTQSILLDIGGFALLTMAVHAHQRGERHTRNSAAFVGGLLMAVTLATVVLITVGNLWPKAADQVQNINQALILARIGMTIVYECTIHLLRHAEQHEQRAAAAQVHQTFSEQVQALERSFSEQVQALARTFSESVQSSERRVSEQVQGLNESFSETAQIGERLAALAATVAGLETAWKHAIEPMQAVAAGASETDTETGNGWPAPLSLVKSLRSSERSVSRHRSTGVKRTERSVTSAVNTGSEKTAFIQSAITEHPDWKNAEIIRAAAAQGLTISPAHVSQVRANRKQPA